MKLLVVVDISALQFFASERGDFFITKSKVSRDISPLKPRQRPHSDVVKLREQKCVDEMAAIDRELGIIDCFLRNLEPRRTRAQETTAAAPIEFCFEFLSPRDQIRQIKSKQIVTFDHIGVALLDQRG